MQLNFVCRTAQKQTFQSSVSTTTITHPSYMAFYPLYIPINSSPILPLTHTLGLRYNGQVTYQPARLRFEGGNQIIQGKPTRSHEERANSM